MLAGCGEVVPVWKQEVSFPEYTLYHNKAKKLEISLDFPEETSRKCRMEFEITYDISGIGRPELPLSIILQKESGDISPPKEFNVVVPLQAEGEWLGIPQDNEVDYVITYIVIPDLELEKGEYSMNLYANDNNNDQIYGVVKILARLYENEALGDEKLK